MTEKSAYDDGLYLLMPITSQTTDILYVDIPLVEEPQFSKT